MSRWLAWDRRPCRWTVACTLAVSLAGGVQASDQGLRPARFSPLFPTDVDAAGGSGATTLAVFSDYSWRQFIALIWPARTDQRGAADAAKQLDAAGARVFESFKADWEVFRPDGARPEPWSQAQPDSPCKGQPLAAGDFVLASYLTGAETGQGAFGNLVGPIVGQNGRYVRYMTGFGRAGFDHIVERALYRREPGRNADFPVGSVNVKSAWIETDGLADKQGYYRRQAWLKPAGSDRCVRREVALVGLHIVQKTAHRPQWIWSSFEHVANVPGASGGKGPFAFNDGSGAPMPRQSPVLFPPPVEPQAPFNIVRFGAIDGPAQAANARYQTALRAAGSVWSNYQLVVTQFPTIADAPGQTISLVNTYPGLATAASVSNSTIETFFQAGAATGCISCHSLARRNGDFVWSVQTHAYPRGDPAEPAPGAGW
jgi:hypothetical protein